MVFGVVPTLNMAQVYEAASAAILGIVKRP